MAKPTDKSPVVITFRQTDAVRDAIVAQRERLRSRAVDGQTITQTDAVASLILAGSLLETAADDPALRDANGYPYFSREQLINRGWQSCLDEIDRMAGSTNSQRDDGDNE
jgi:hypothetical protein